MENHHHLCCLRFLFGFPLFTSLAPIAVYALISLFEQTFSNENYDTHFSKGLSKIKSAILQGYSSLFSFSIMMIAVNVIFRVILALTLKKSDSFEDLKMSPLPTSRQKASSLKGEVFQRMLFLILAYGIIYISLGFLRSTLNHDISSQLEILSKTNEPFSFNQDRVLEEKQQQDESFASPSSDLKTLSVGRRLSSLTFEPNSILISKTGKLAFAITMVSGELKVIDISDHQYPIILGSLELTKVGVIEKFKTMKLSADEKTLFATTARYLEIINVTNPRAPSLISFYKNPLLDYLGFPEDFRPTLALSQDETILYAAALGLQIFNITSLSSPKLLYSVRSPEVNYKFTVSSLVLLPGGSTLAFVNNTRLELYDVSDPTKPALLSSYSAARISINSIALSNKGALAIYAAGFLLGTNDQVALEKINIQDSLSPQPIELYDLKSKSKYPPSILEISPNETNIFLSYTFQQLITSFSDMIAYDLLKKQTMIQGKSLLSQTLAFTIIPQSNHVVVSSNRRFEIFEFFQNYPNTKTFCGIENTDFFLPFTSPIKLVEPSNNIWFALTDEGEDVFSSYNMTNDASPKKMLSLQMPSETILKLSIKKNRAFLQTYTDVHVFKISPGLSYIDSLMPENSEDAPITDFQISNNANIAYIIRKTSGNDIMILSAINFTNFSSIIENPFHELSTNYLGKIALPSKTQDFLFILLDQIYVYNASDPMAPVFITSVSVTVDDERLYSHTVSPDAKTLFVITVNLSGRTLKIFDISNLTNVKLLQTLFVAGFLPDQGKRPFILSNDMKKGFVVAYDHILVLDLKNLTLPGILGMAPYGLSSASISNFFLSPDEKTGYIHTSNQVLKVNLDLTYTLYLSQENFLLGKKYSDSVMLLNSNKKSDFLIVNSDDYKIIKLSFSQFEFNTPKGSIQTTFTSFPSWIFFDSENQILTVESTNKRDLGSYTLYSVSSKKIPQGAFDSVLRNFNTSLQAEDLFILLTSIGFVDNQKFLTKSFGSFEDFLFPPQLEEMKLGIYKILRSYRIETFTDFSILPTLKLSTSSTGKFSLSTTSHNSVKIEIRLLDSKTQFLQKTYGTVLPLIRENKNMLTIEGPLESVNKALRELVININSTEQLTCQGEITINDNLNPPVYQFYENISEYFFKNGLPMLNTSLNLTIQQQIDPIGLSTGNYFSISLDPYTFKDQYSESLTYLLVRRENNEDDTLPLWLTFQGLTLKGTPPEEIFKRQFKFGLIVKNEFKQIEIPVVLKVSISWLFAGKLLMRYAPYILTAIGLIVYASRIYNIVAKKRYRHAKDFYVKVGEQITSRSIFPIRFIAEEKLEGDLILKNFTDKKAFFIDNEIELKAALKEAMNKMPSEDRNKLKLYLREESQKRVSQYLLNELIMQQLNSSKEKATKDFFEGIKDKWTEFIDYDDSCGFIVNEESFKALLEEKQKTDDLSETLSDSLLLKKNAINIDLLKKAFVVYAIKSHELEYLHGDLDILINLQKPRNKILKFFKKDLQQVKYSDKGILTYGLSFNIKQNALEITGIPDDSFEGKVLVIQIVDSHQRILKEIWIHGVPKIMDNGERLSFLSESQAKGKEYEVF